MGGTTVLPMAKQVEKPASAYETLHAKNLATTKKASKKENADEDNASDVKIDTRDGRDVGQFAGFCHTFNRKNRDVLESVEKGRKRDVQADFLDRNSIVLTFTTEIVANNKVASGEIGFPLPAGTHLKKLADNETLAGVQDGP